jgi:hypothetical protein
MRIIGQIDHPVLKITAFKMDNKVSVKFESGLYEQIFKFRSGEGIDTVEDVRRLVDGPFLEKVLLHLQQMHQHKMEAMCRLHGAGEPSDEFEEII